MRSFSAPICIPCDRHCEAPQGAVAIRFLCIAHLLQICGFAGLFIVLSFVLGTPLSLLVQRKLQRKHTKAGRRKSPRLAIHPSARLKLSLSTIPRRAGRRSALLLMKCFQLGKRVLSPMKRANPIYKKSGALRRIPSLSTVRCPLSTKNTPIRFSGG